MGTNANLKDLTVKPTIGRRGKTALRVSQKIDGFAGETLNPHIEDDDKQFVGVRVDAGKAEPSEEGWVAGGTVTFSLRHPGLSENLSLKFNFENAASEKEAISKVTPKLRWAANAFLKKAEEMK